MGSDHTRRRGQRVAVSGSSGLVGSALISVLAAEGYEVHRMVRPGKPASPPDLNWDPTSGTVDAAVLDGVHSVVHLAGENIAAGRWTAAQKTAIATSRIQGTRKLTEALATLPNPPSAFIAASAIGFYGDRGDEVLDEDSPSGDTFLASVARGWEDAGAPAVDAGIRVVHLRIGIVLSRAGGALAKMLPPFKLGLGGPIGSGKQWMSWIALADLVRVIEFLMSHGLSGPVNAVAPNALTNRDFVRCLGKVLRRPAFLPLPAAAVELLLGEMGTELLLHSTRVRPKKLLDAGFRFQFEDLHAALAAELD